MGVIAPLNLLNNAEGTALRRYLVEQRYLDAVIELPTQHCPGKSLCLLVLRHLHMMQGVAFISGKVNPPGASARPCYDTATILQSYRACRSHQVAPYLTVLDDTTMAQHVWSLDARAYSK